MREKVSGIGEKIGSLMKKNNISYDELSEKTGISKNILKAIVELKKEPYLKPEMDKILDAFGMNDKEQVDFILEWVQLIKTQNI